MPPVFGFEGLDGVDDGGTSAAAKKAGAKKAASADDGSQRTPEEMREIRKLAGQKAAQTRAERYGENPPEGGSRGGR